MSKLIKLTGQEKIDLYGAIALLMVADPPSDAHMPASMLNMWLKARERLRDRYKNEIFEMSAKAGLGINSLRQDAAAGDLIAKDMIDFFDKEDRFI